MAGDGSTPYSGDSRHPPGRVQVAVVTQMMIGVVDQHVEHHPPEQLPGIPIGLAAIAPQGLGEFSVTVVVRRRFRGIEQRQTGDERHTVDATLIAADAIETLDEIDRMN